MAEGVKNFSFSYRRSTVISFIFRQPYCSNTTNVNLCSHIWSVCYLAQSVFDSKVIAEPCLRKCPSGVNLYPAGSKPERIPKKSRYGFALNYGIPMGQSTPKTWVEFKKQKLNSNCFFSFSASGSYCVKDSDPPFCPKNENEIGDKRCCLEAPEWNELI